jgi:hypothetical protein
MNRAIVILPGKSGAGAVMDALRRYIILLPVAAVFALAVEYLVPLAPYWNTVPSVALDSGEKAAGQGLLAGAANTTLANYAASPVPSAVPTAIPPMPSAMPVPANVQPEVARSVMDQVSQSVVPYFHHAGLLFFAGCLLVLLLLVILEYARYARTPKAKK